jgi:uncharacterized protein DUF3605
LSKLTRLPSQLQAYRVWSTQINVEYGSVTNFLLQKRLYWEPLPSSVDDPNVPLAFAFKSNVPFRERSDYRILINDWPYGLEPGIKHICVWLKNRLPVDSNLGALLEEGNAICERFVQDTFVKPLGVEGQDKVQWFKNPTLLQSLRGVEHLHILLRGIDMLDLEGILEVPPFDS